MTKKFLVVENDQDFLKYIPVIVQTVKSEQRDTGLEKTTAPWIPISDNFAKNRNRFQKRSKAL